MATTAPDTSHHDLELVDIESSYDHELLARQATSKQSSGRSSRRLRIARSVGNLSKRLRSHPAVAKYGPFCIGVLFAISAYILIGFYSVLARYLQNDAQLPRLTINGFAAAVAWLFLAPVVMGRRLLSYIRDRIRANRSDCGDGGDIELDEPGSSSGGTDENQTACGSSDATSNTEAASSSSSFAKKLFLSILIYSCFAAVILVRSNMNLYASKYAKATYVYIVYLSNPFLTTAITLLLGGLATLGTLFHVAARRSQEAEATPAKSSKWSSRLFALVAFVWLLGAVLGGVFIILGTTSRDPEGSFTYSVGLEYLVTNFSYDDTIGCGFSFFGVTLMAIYNVALSYIMGSSSSKFYSFQGADLSLLQHTIVASGFTTLSLISGYDLTPWLHLNSTAIFAFLLYALGVWLASDLLYIWAVQSIGSVNVSACVAVTLVSNMLFSWVLNGEPISNLFQIIGAGIVLICVTGFMVSKRTNEKQQPASATALQKSHTHTDAYVPSNHLVDPDELTSSSVDTESHYVPIVIPQLLVTTTAKATAIHAKSDSHSSVDTDISAMTGIIVENACIASLEHICDDDKTRPSDEGQDSFEERLLQADDDDANHQSVL